MALEGDCLSQQFAVMHDAHEFLQTLAEIKLRGLTGATVLAIQRDGQAVIIPRLSV